MSVSSDNIKFELVDLHPPKLKQDECLVSVYASSINPSDVKAILGKLPGLVWPRIPGRDYAGVVVGGPSEHIGKEVWGTGGDLGISRDGTHGEFVVVPVESIHEKPKNLSMLEAGSLGVPWTCAWLGLMKGAEVTAGETVAVLGSNGKVGEATIQLATAKGAEVIAVERSDRLYRGFSSKPVDVINLSQEEDLREALLDRTNGRGVDVVMNSVGSPYFEIANECMAKEGRQIIISTLVEESQFNLRLFYRGNHKLIGVSNLDYDCVASGEIMESLRTSFEDQDYKPYMVKEDNIIGLDNIADGYEMVLKNLTRDRVVINMQT